MMPSVDITSYENALLTIWPSYAEQYGMTDDDWKIVHHRLAGCVWPYYWMGWGDAKEAMQDAAELAWTRYMEGIL